MPPPQQSQPVPPPEDEDDDLFDRLQPAALLARGLKTPVEPVPPAPKQPTALLAELFGDYRIAGELSHGGFGILYRGEHRKLKRRMALKILSHTLTSNAAAVARFEREIEAVGKLDHPGIVRAFDAGERGGVWFLAMEFIEGMDLSQLTKTLGPLAPADAAEIARQAALALAHAHGHGLIHRDVKPSNIMLALPAPDSSPLSRPSPPTVKVLDFGLAQLSAADSAGLTISADFLGTVDYIAPEQVENPRAADPRSDLYGLGATLHRLLTGLAPHEQPDSQETLLQKLTQVAHHDAAPVRTRRAEIPEGLAALVDSLLQRDPALRPQSAAAVVEALTPFCGGADLAALAARAAEASPPLQWPAPGKTMSLRRRRSRRWMLATGAVAAVALAAGLWLGNRASHPTGTVPSAGLAQPALPAPFQLHDPDWQLSGAWPAVDHAVNACYLGNAMVYCAVPAKGGGLFTFDPAAGTSKLLTADGNGVVATSPDGRWLTMGFQRGKGLIMRLQLVPEMKTLPTFTFRTGDSDPTGSVFIPDHWKGGELLRPGDVLTADCGFGSPDGLWCYRCDAEDSPRQLVAAFDRDYDLQDVTVSGDNVYVGNRISRRDRIRETRPEDFTHRLLRFEKDRLIPCRTDQPIFDTTALAADPRSRSLFCLDGGQIKSDPDHKRLLELRPARDPDTWTVHVIASRLPDFGPACLHISHDGQRLLVTTYAGLFELTRAPMSTAAPPVVPDGPVQFIKQ